MLSFDENNGVIIAQLENYHKKYSKFVFYDKNGKNDEKKYDDDELRNMLSLKYGKTETRYNKQLKDKKLDTKNDIMIVDENKNNLSFLPFYPENEHKERNVYYIFGRSGSGKSYLAKKLSYLYSKLMNVYVISPVKDEGYTAKFLNIDDLVVLNETNDYAKQKKAYEKAKIRMKYIKKEIETQAEKMELEVKLNDMKPIKEKSNTYKFTDKYNELIKEKCLFIYDDTEAETKQEKLTFMQKNQLLTGRHTDTSMIILNHLANKGASTRDTVNESNIYIFFQPYNRYTNYFLKEYLQFDKNQIATVQTMLKNSRFIAVYKNESILISEKQILTY